MTTDRTVALAASLMLALGAGPAVAQDATVEVVADPAFAAAGWLAGELAADPDGILDGFGDGDVGLTADAVLGLAVTGVAADAQARSTDAVAAVVDDYVAPDGTVGGGQAAKALLLAASQGRDVTDFGGRDLEADLRSSVGPDGAVGTSGFAHALAVMALGRVAADAADPDLVAAVGHLDTICDTTDVEACGGPDTAAASLVAYRDVGDDEAVAALADALAAVQAADGSFSSFDTPNANSTGLAGWALALADRDAAASSAAGFVGGLQLVGDLPATDVGALAFAAEGFGSLAGAAAAGEIPDGERGSYQFATAQGILALASASGTPVDLTDADATSAAAGAPAPTAPTGVCPDGDGVTLVVDLDRLSDAPPVTACVEPFEGMDGLDLLRAAGVAVGTLATDFGPAVCTLEGLPADVLDCFGSQTDPNGFWSLFTGDPTTGEWTPAAFGVAGDAPAAGDVRGWVWEDDFSDDVVRTPTVSAAAPLPDTGAPVGGALALAVALLLGGAVLARRPTGAR